MTIEDLTVHRLTKQVSGVLEDYSEDDINEGGIIMGDYAHCIICGADASSCNTR